MVAAIRIRSDVVHGRRDTRDVRVETDEALAFAIGVMQSIVVNREPPIGSTTFATSRDRGPTRDMTR